ncbi:hypothetical protein K493DRAFT_303241 [Basidiobolus meristosporus CBS 931.73]|uniref:Uncharacterized protein n=1 Tax=Basidiobolus meristosporus CBS 931.73 TaxID=1314790 RepID=A0A1Y1Y3L0_9FUNG|nr:hypothetical protein K493DRAFT_303241 [Basidiobolus meristosporus CBS 931.73]|eukprot:ORX92587.1 hypothetical protein K493DRAFT_303241 [Basidiobolus meristosporus CBS 931.73]
MGVTSIRLCVAIFILVFNLNVLWLTCDPSLDCCYVVVPKLVDAFNFYVAIQARHPDIGTHNNTYHTEVSFPAHYQVREFPKACEKRNNATNMFTCVEMDDMFAARFLLFTPGNSNQEPSLKVNIYNDLCAKQDYCQRPTPVDKGLLNLGPLGVYPKPLAIASICGFATMLICGAYLIYRSNRVHLLTDSSADRGCFRIRNGASGRKVLSLPLFMCGCCPKASKSSNRGVSTGMIENAPPVTFPVNTSSGDNHSIPPLRSISIQDLGSGLRDGAGSSLPRYSLILDPGPVESRDKIEKQSKKSKLDAKAELYRTKSNAQEHVKISETMHISRSASTKNKSQEPLLNLDEKSLPKVKNQSISRNASVKKGPSRNPSTSRSTRENMKRTPSLMNDPKTKRLASRSSSVRDSSAKEIRRTHSAKYKPDISDAIMQEDITKSQGTRE